MISLHGGSREMRVHYLTFCSLTLQELQGCESSDHSPADLCQLLCACRYHGFCSKTFAVAIDRLFLNLSLPLAPVKDYKNIQHRPKSLPPMFGGGRHTQYAVSSYWALHVDQFQEYVQFARMFLVTLESLWGLHMDVNRCPLTFVNQRPGYGNDLCWCFIMERGMRSTKASSA